MRIISANISGSFTLNGVDVTNVTVSSSIWSGSMASRVSSLEQFSSSLDAIYATDAQLAAATASLSASLALPIAALNSYTSSNSTTISALNAQTASLLAYTSSNDANISALNSFSSSILSYTSSNNATIASINSYTSSANTKFAGLDAASGSAITRLNSLENRTGSYATTGSNVFAGGQYFSSSFNPTGFTTTASLYTDGGIQVTRDAYFSSSLFIKGNLTVFGTQSVAYISSSQLNIGTNIINVNTDTPSIRFGGLAVYDSGSTGLTGSMLWDSQDNQWIYSNPSGSAYDSAMFLVGPRNSGTLGNEVGISCNFLSKGNGMHHMTSSGIFEDGSRTCFYGSGFITNTGVSCFTTSCASAIVGGTISGTTGNFTGNIVTTGATAEIMANGAGSSNTVGGSSRFTILDSLNTRGWILQQNASYNLSFWHNNSGWSNVINFTPAGAATFSSTVDGTIINSTSNAFRFSGNNALSLVSLCSQNVVKINAAGYWGTQLVGANDQGILIDNSGNVGIGTLPSGRIHVASGNAHLNNYFTTGTSAGWDIKTYFTGGNSGSEQFLYFGFPGCTTDAFVQRGSNSRLDLGTSSTARLSISATGAACFACELTAKTLGTNDLILNNLNYECANYVDGTRGSWLIQEGACDLFIINQVSCKKYKFNLIEIE